MKFYGLTISFVMAFLAQHVMAGNLRTKDSTINITMPLEATHNSRNLVDGPRPADCPASYTSSGLDCIQPENTYTKRCSFFWNTCTPCRTGYTDMERFCFRPQSTVPSTCKKGEEKVGALCYVIGTAPKPPASCPLFSASQCSSDSSCVCPDPAKSTKYNAKALHNGQDCFACK